MRNKDRQGGEAIRRTGGNGRYCRSVAFNGVLYIHGVSPVDLEADVQEQALDLFRQLDKLMAYNGTSKQNLLTVDIYLQDINEYPEFNAVWENWILDGYEPTRNVMGLSMSIPGYHVKMSVTAALNP